MRCVQHLTIKTLKGNKKNERKGNVCFQSLQQSGSRQRRGEDEIQREGGREEDEGDPPVIAGATWGPTQGLGLILK